MIGAEFLWPVLDPDAIRAGLFYVAYCIFVLAAFLKIGGVK